jgi:molybdopterin converting factor small subunit
MREPGEVIVEFFGIPRQRAGQVSMVVKAQTLGQVLGALRTALPGFQDLLRSDGRLAPQYRMSLDGQRFLEDLQEVIPPGARLLLLSADVGG